MINAVLVEKSSMKQDIYYNTLEIFKEFKKEIKKIVDQLNEDASKKDRRLIIEFSERGEFEVELKFAGDVLIFYMHTNVFKFNAEHDISKTKYAKEDIRRRYCGIISVYNFLADSFKYNRANDLGYMIARVFVNNENHYALEGKEQLGQLHVDYEKAVIDQAAIKAIETVDYCLGKILSSTAAPILITADHGNLEMMLDPKTKKVHTALKSKNPKAQYFVTLPTYMMSYLRILPNPIFENSLINAVRFSLAIFESVKT